MHIVLLPGMDGTGILHDDFIQHIGSEFHITVVRYPTQDAKNYSELEGIVLRSLPTDEPFFLLAESFSGPIGISIASNSPANLRGLILCCTFAKSPIKLPKSLLFLTRFISFRLIPNWFIQFLTMGKYKTPQLCLLLSEALEQVSNNVMQTRINAALRMDVRNKLKHIAVPVIYLQARYDRIMGKESAEEIQKNVPELEIITFEAPHFLLQVLPAETASAVRKFIYQQKYI